MFFFRRCCFFGQDWKITFCLSKLLSYIFLTFVWCSLSALLYNPVHHRYSRKSVIWYCSCVNNYGWKMKVMKYIIHSLFVKGLSFIISFQLYSTVAEIKVIAVSQTSLPCDTEWSVFVVFTLGKNQNSQRKTHLATNHLTYWRSNPGQNGGRAEH